MKSLLQYYHALDNDVKVTLTHALRILVILVLAGVAEAIAARLIRAFRRFMERRDPAQQSRIQTLGRVFRYTAAVVIWLVGGMLVLGELGISVAPLLATAGVAGIAIGFGAQSLIKDYFNGFFLLLEDQLRQGDVVDLGGPNGAVEEVTLRYVRLRNFEGHVIFVPNGEIKIVKNMTRDFAQAVIEVGVAYREELDEALDVMRQVGREMRADPVFGPKIADEAEIVGVEKWGDSAVTIRCRLKVVPPAEQWNVRREFLKRLKKAYNARGIEIPFPHVTVYPGQLKDGSSPALRVSGLLPTQ
ncbi:MAG TPA: mechanosensitive ion channel family protein [Burkholderiales bacterium]|nr:mechanosensitive ion channel family protein [Burkholderiales bacterium]